MADLSNWIINTTDLSDPAVSAFLANIRQYDPNATYVQRQDVGGEGNLIGSPYYHLSYDVSKLPGADGTGQLGTGSSATDTSNRGYEYQGPNWISVTDSNRDRVVDPSKVTNSSVYGNVTDASNILGSPDGWLEKLGPLAVAAFGFGLGGIPGLTEGFGSQFATGAPTGAADAVSGASFADPWDVMGDPSAYGLGPVNTPVGSAESSLYGPSVGSDPVGAFNGTAPISDLSTSARIGDVLRNGGVPGLDNIRQSLSELGLSDLANVGKAIAPALGGSPSSGGGLLGGGGGGAPQGFGQSESAMSILRKWYADDPEIRGLLQRKGLLNG